MTSCSRAKVTSSRSTWTMRVVPTSGLAVLSLSQAVDNTSWPNDHFRGALLHRLDKQRGRRCHGAVPPRSATRRGDAMWCRTSAPSVCPAPPNFPANYLATLNPWTGQVTAVTIKGHVRAARRPGLCATRLGLGVTISRGRAAVRTGTFVAVAARI